MIIPQDWTYSRQPRSSVGFRGFESHPPRFLTNPPLSQSIVGEIVSFALWMKKHGYRDSTVRGCVRVLETQNYGEN